MYGEIMAKARLGPSNKGGGTDDSLVFSSCTSSCGYSIGSSWIQASRMLLAVKASTKAHSLHLAALTAIGRDHGVGIFRVVLFHKTQDQHGGGES